MSSYQASINNSLFQIEMHEPVTNDWIVVQKLKKSQEPEVELKKLREKWPNEKFRAVMLNRMKLKL